LVKFRIEYIGNLDVKKKGVNVKTAKIIRTLIKLFELYI